MQGALIGHKDFFLLPMPGVFVHLSVFYVKQEKRAPENSNKLLPVVTSPPHTFLRLGSSSENKLFSVTLFNAVLVSTQLF